MNKFLLDTNVYDYLLSNNFDTEKICSKVSFYITNIQTSEIRNITDGNKRNKILGIITKLKPNKLLLESGIWLDDIYWDDEQPWIDDISIICKKLRGNSKKNWKDSLTGEVVKKHKLILVTDDVKFISKAKRNDIKAINSSNFINFLTNIEQ
jgi:rRNA-processing protein FCF1